MKHKYLILIVGPTAVGKTDLCIELATRFKAEIFSCDSRQFYRELSIGTAKPTDAELAQVKHHFINTLSIAEKYSVGDFEKDCIRSLKTYFKNKDLAIMTGGSGLYAKAITHGLDTFPLVSTELRKQVKQDLAQQGLPFLYKELLQKDPDYAAEVDIANPQRITRAIEIIRASEQTYSSFRKGQEAKRPFKIIKIALDRPRQELHVRINKRVDEMIAGGLIDEVKKNKEFKNNGALQTVGYKESFDYIDALIDFQTCVELIKRNTRRYAKRQLTWFKNQDTFHWCNPPDISYISEYIQKTIDSNETN